MAVDGMSLQQRQLMKLQTAIAGASNDSWTEGDPEMRKENLVNHVALLKQMAMDQEKLVLEVVRVHHLSYWTLEHLSKGHGGLDDHGDCAGTAFALKMVKNVSIVNDDGDEDEKRTLFDGAVKCIVDKTDVDDDDEYGGKADDGNH